MDATGNKSATHPSSVRPTTPVRGRVDPLDRDCPRGRHVLRQRLSHLPWVRSGRSGIRTHERVAPLTVFKTVAFVRSAILPNAIYLRRCIDAAANPSARALLP